MLKSHAAAQRAKDPSPRLVSLGSGSAGNAFFLEFEETRLLVDTGFSAAETARRMRLKGLDPDKLDGVLVTHEHIDHVRGVAVLSKRHKVPVYIAAGTYAAYLRAGRPLRDRVEFQPGHPFTIGSLEVLPFSVPHDAADPVGFRIQAGRTCIGIATDLGYAPEEVLEHLRDGDVLILESNHDVDMLKNGPYPWNLKQRILGRAGHLSNDALSAMLDEVVTEKCSAVVPAHISKINNRPEMARMTCEISLTRLGLGGVRVVPADQDRPVTLWGDEPPGGPWLIPPCQRSVPE